jgi:hypothetical protein
VKTKLALLLTFAIASHALAQTTMPTAAAAPDARFKQLDKNGDGKLSPEELNMPNIFSRLDKDKDGFVSAAEMTEYFSKRTAKTAPAPTAPVDPNIKPRSHGEEATAAALKPDVLAKLDIAMQQAVAAKEVSGVIGLIHHNGQRGYFEAFGMQDIEAANSAKPERFMPG